MSGRSRHGLHVVRDGDAPAAEKITPLLPSPGGRPLVLVTDPGHVPRRTGPERLRTDPPGGIQPAARASGSTGAGAVQEAIRDRRRGSRTPVSSAGVSAGHRRRRRDAEMLLIIRRAERDSGLLDGGADVRSRA